MSQNAHDRGDCPLPERYKHVRLWRGVSMSLGEFVLCVLPISFVLVCLAIWLPTRWIGGALPVVFVVNGLWWGYIWQSKLRPRAIESRNHSEQ